MQEFDDFFKKLFFLIFLIIFLFFLSFVNNFTITV